MARIYKIFISHSWAHVDDLKLLRNLLESRGYFNVEFTEFPPTDSIDSINTYYIRKRISERIEASDVVLGIAGVYASYSEWMTKLNLGDLADLPTKPCAIYSRAA